MIEFLIELRQYSVYFLLAIFGVVLISFALILKAKHKKKGLIGIAILFIITFIITGMNFIIEMSLRDKITEKAKNALKKDSKILINGKINDVDKNQLLTDLMKMNGWYFTNKSYPDTAY